MPIGVYKRTKPAWNKGRKIVDQKLSRHNYYKLNREEIIEKAINYQKNHKKERKVKDARYRKNHRVEISQRRWWATPRGVEVMKRAREKWLKSPQGKASLRVSAHNRRIKTQDLTIEIILQVYKENVAKYGVLTCYLCIKPVPEGKDHLDHKTPLSRGGSNKKRNLGVACEFCNCSKRDKTEREYRKEKALCMC